MTIAVSDSKPDSRVQGIQDWLRSIGIANAGELAPASADASFRRYFRVPTPDGSRIVMDAPPDQENCRPFVRIASSLQAMKLNGPHVLASDFENGYLLLSDLGSTQYLQALQEDPGRADQLYGDAISALVRLQTEGAQHAAELPQYDEQLLRTELALFNDWLCERHLGITFDAAGSKQWRQTCHLLVDNALAQPQVFVHRDYHSRNLMLTPENNPGILDFQDAVVGPYTYDAVSLLKDCYIVWPDEQVASWAMSFYLQKRQHLPASIDEPTFIRQFELMGVQRQLKAAGIFARLNHRDGKPDYLQDIPRTLNYVLEIAPRYDELAFLAELIGVSVLPELQEIGK